MSARARTLRQSEPTDAELVACVLDGDDDAYGMLVHRYQNLLYRHARGMGLDHDTSLDLVQDAFVRAFDRLDTCRDGAHYRAWLFRIGHNLCVDELRNVRRLCIPMSTVEHVDQVAGEPRDDDETTLTLRAALERLPRALREAFLLKHDAGYTYDEVAVITRVSPSAVKMRVHRAREALRAFLIAEGVRDNASNDTGDDPGAAERLGDEESQIQCDARANSAHVSATRRMS